MPSPSWRRYLRFWGSNLDADLDDEFRFHFETEVEELVARGMSQDAARAEAQRRFGDVSLYRRECRGSDARRAGRERRMENLHVIAQDLRFALRSLRRQPAFAAIAVVTLALGIGANTAIFSVVNGVLLKPLPYREPERLVMLWETMKDIDQIRVSYPNYLDWRARQRTFEDIAVYKTFESFNMTGQGDAERVRGGVVSANFYPLLGVRPALGRLFNEGDDRPGAERVAVLSHAFFETRFGADSSIVGKTLILDGNAYTVVGVLPSYERLVNRDVIVPAGPFAATPQFARINHPGLTGIGRLKRGVTLQQARADLARISAELRAEYPNDNAGIGSGGAPLMDMIVGDIKPALRTLMIAVGFVLLIACANVANLLLSRAAARHREFALRTALGASRSRIVRQLLTESVVLAVVGGALGVGIAMAGVKLLMALQPSNVPRLTEIRVDAVVLLFAFAVSVVTGILFGLVPALQSDRHAPVEDLKESGRSVSASAGRQRTRATLTVAEVALAVVLLAASGLLVRSFAKLTAVDPGFDARNVVIALVELPASKYSTLDQERAAFDALLEKVRAIPGVEAATVSTDLPLSTSWQAGVSFEGQPDDPAKRPMLNASVVDPTYFETLRVRLVGGRLLSPSDGAQPRVMLISESVARRFFPNNSPIGRRMKVGRPDNKNPWMTIVGVVSDTKTDGLQVTPRGSFYMPRAQEEMRSGWLMVRSELPVERLTNSLRRAVADVDPDVPLALTRTMQSVLSELVEDPKFSMLLLTIFAAVALVLASVGIYGVISYNVTQRSGEIGVRMALGAQRRDVLQMVVRQAMMMAGAGVAIGMLLALWGGQSLSSMLYGVGPRDPLVLASVSVFLLLVALTAAMAPAIRAARIDPVVAMRGD